MKKFAIASALTVVLMGTSALAGPVESIVSQLEGYGYSNIQVSKAAGKVTVIGDRDGQKREVIYDLRNSNLISDDRGVSHNDNGQGDLGTTASATQTGVAGQNGVIDDNGMGPSTGTGLDDNGMGEGTETGSDDNGSNHDNGSDDNGSNHDNGSNDNGSNDNGGNDNGSNHDNGGNDNGSNDHNGNDSEGNDD